MHNVFRSSVLLERSSLFGSLKKFSNIMQSLSYLLICNSDYFLFPCVGSLCLALFFLFCLAGEVAISLLSKDQVFVSVLSTIVFLFKNLLFSFLALSTCFMFMWVYLCLLTVTLGFDSCTLKCC